MADLEEVIKALECCVSPVFKGFPYQSHIADKGCEVIECPYRDDCDQLLLDALELLKAQEPRVMTADEMIEAVKTNEAVYVEESPEGSSQHCFWGLVVEGCDPPQDGGYNYPGGVLFNVINAHEDMWDGDFYGLNSPLGWRCWTEKPTEEQRKAVKWE